MLVVWLASALALVSAAEYKDVFQAGEGGYSCFRIPSLLRLPNGNMALYAEGRNMSCSDHGWVNIVYKISEDDGETWGPLRLVHSASSVGREVTVGNPSPVVVGGKVLMVFCMDNRAVFTLRSEDEAGERWPSQPTNITALALPGVPSLSWIATGPPQGIVTESGRIVIAGNWNGAAGVLLSDDEGKTWSSCASQIPGGDECQAAPAPNGSLVLNMRTRTGFRSFTWSDDNGKTWSVPTSGPFPYKLGADCEGSTIRVPATDQMLFSTPFSSKGRYNMTVWRSRDSGASWQLLTGVGSPDEGAAYSALLPINSSYAALVWERDGYKTLSFQAVKL